MSPLFADAHELDCPAMDGSVMSRRELRSFYGQAVNVSIRRGRRAVGWRSCS